MAKKSEEFRPLAVKADSKELSKNIRIKIQGRSNMTLLPDFYMIDLYNLSKEDLATVTSAKKIEATGDNKSTLLIGELEDMYIHRINTNTVTTLAVSDGKSLWDKTVDKTVGAGSGIRNTIITLLSGYPFGGFNAKDTRLPRAQTFSGKAADYISVLAKSVDARAFVTRGLVQVIQKGSASTTITLKEEDIMSVPAKSGGIITVKTKAMTGYPVGTFIVPDGKKYRLVAQSIDADNFEGPWVSELILVDESQLSKTGMEGG